MSTLLREAIVDAKALREAALKNAENMVIEKYSQEIKTAVNRLLEQELDFGAPTTGGLPGDMGGMMHEMGGGEGGRGGGGAMGKMAAENSGFGGAGGGGAGFLRCTTLLGLDA